MLMIVYYLSLGYNFKPVGSQTGTAPMANRYLVLRQATYHYRRRIPREIQPYVHGRQWWKVSLKTGHPRLAELKARELATRHDQLIARVRDTPNREKLMALEQIDDDYFASDEGPFARFSDAHMRVSHAALNLSNTVLDEMVAGAAAKLPLLTPAERDAVSAAGGIEGFFHVASLERSKLSSASDEIEKEVRTKHLLLKLGVLAKLGFQQPLLLLPDDPNNPRMSRAQEAWFAKRKQGETAINRHRVAIRRFTELHGDLPVREISRPMVRAYLDRIENLADHRKVPASLRGSLLDPGADVPRVSAPTVERHLASLKAFLQFCWEQDWVTGNMAAGLRSPKDTRPKAGRRRSFSREERLQLLARAVAEYGENGDMPWLIRLGTYTGGRLEELAQLARSNVRSVDGTWIIDIDDLDGRHVKSRASVKQIPLHPAIREDFVAWVGAGRGDRVFASFRADRGRYSGTLSGQFARLMDRAGLSDPRLTFHSLRHTLKREMSNARIDPDVRRLILGHAPKDAHDGYEGHSLQAIAEELARLPALL